jgi:hypothetical protein
MMPAPSPTDPICDDHTKPITLLDDVRALAAEFAQRAKYVEHSSPRAAGPYSMIAQRLQQLAAKHSPSTQTAMKDLK